MTNRNIAQRGTGGINNRPDSIVRNLLVTQNLSVGSPTSQIFPTFGTINLTNGAVTDIFAGDNANFMVIGSGQFQSGQTANVNFYSTAATGSYEIIAFDITNQITISASPPQEGEFTLILTNTGPSNINSILLVIKIRGVTPP